MPTNSYGDYRPPDDFAKMADNEMIIELLKFQDSIQHVGVEQALTSDNLNMLINALIRALEK